MDYELDNLGWFEFESLVQTVLKVRLGAGVEAWGGRGDWGRDAYFEGSLRYPSVEAAEGPFVFQCKFVESANAAGAKPVQAVLDAVGKEVLQISKRLAVDGVWATAPTHYGLLTNAPLTPDSRRQIIAQIVRVMPGCHVHVHDGHDLCAWLNEDNKIVRAFPQLMSIRQLHELLRQFASPELVSRSQVAIDLARAESAVFVPTAAYHRAVQVLQKNSFVVLEGPPEMGKTTIARIMALAQLSRGWEAHECRGPEDVLKAYSKGAQQVFVADDFFGRTYYEPARVTVWQDELPHILHRLDHDHWLILTSRAHLLAMGKRELDVAGPNERFPELGEVVVDAGTLTTQEKARILYRHAKASDLRDVGRKIIRQSARAIVLDRHFTPERIRKLIANVLPSLLGNDLSAQQYRSAIADALANPTDRMRATFRSLPVPHRWLLFALLSGEHSVGSTASDNADNPTSLRGRYEALCPVDAQRPFDDVVREMTEAFVKRSSTVFGDHVTWIHPSCQDLAIVELGRSASDRLRFLAHCSDGGLLLATSVGGGAKGTQSFPLLKNDADWQAFSGRAAKITELDPSMLTRLWRNLETAEAKTAEDPARRQSANRLRIALSTVVLPAAMKAVEEAAEVSPISVLKELFEVRAAAQVSIPVCLKSAWGHYAGEAADALTETDSVVWQVAGAPWQFSKFVELVAKYDPEVLSCQWAQESLKGMIALLTKRGDEEARTSYYDDHSQDDLQEVIEGYESLEQTYALFAKLDGVETDHRARLKEAARHFGAEASSHQDELRPERDSDLDGEFSPNADDVDIDELFSDL